MTAVKKINLILLIGFVFVTFLFAEENFPFLAVVVIEGANVRTDSTINSETIIKLDKDESVVVRGSFYEWYRITLPKSASCYVFSKYISALDEKTGVVNSENVNIRLRPDTKSPILGKLKKGQTVNIIKFVDNWYIIEPTEETYGWIHKTAVRKKAELKR
ncbi:MAG: SH3 domain-containing protein [Candidatus Omnitrophica bacterium]|nr:SH3 domain-containing protein [Candidatus Omnitrophota bacterium]